MTQISQRGFVSRIGLLQLSIILLTLITAFIHLQKWLTMSTMAAPTRALPGQHGGLHPGGGPAILRLLPLPLSTLFLLNGIAYIVLIVALYLPVLRPYQRIVRWLLIILAAVTIVAYFLIVGTQFNLLGYIDKPIEVALIVLLLVEEWQSRRKNRAAVEI